MDKDTVFENEAIRDTAVKTSEVSNSGEFTAKTICVMSSLDQDVTLTLEGSCQGTVWMQIGSSWVESGNGYQTVSVYFPHYRVKAQCSTAPTTGDLDVIIVKTKGY